MVNRTKKAMQTNPNTPWLAWVIHTDALGRERGYVENAPYRRWDDIPLNRYVNGVEARQKTKWPSGHTSVSRCGRFSFQEE
jgi:hypothetical protein